MADSVETKPRALREPEEKAALPGPASTDSRRRPSLHWILVGAVLLIAVSLFWLWQYFSIRESTDNAQIDGHIHPVSAKVGGTVLAVHVADNQFVEAGTVLVEIDPRDYQVVLTRAKANLAEAEAMWRAAQAQIPITAETTTSQLSDTQAGVAEAQASLLNAQKEAEATKAQLVMAQGRLREAQANYEKAAKDLERMQQLVAKEEVSQQQYDAAAASAASLRAAVDAAQAAVAYAELNIQAAESRINREQAKVTQAEATVQAARTAPQQIAVARSRADSAQAQWEQAKASVEQAQLNLNYAVIRAAVSGVVSKKTVEPGQIVQPGQPLLAVVPLEDIWVTANFKETQLNKMRPGQKVTISVDAYGGRKYQGHVDSIAAATGAKFSLLPPENATGNFVKVVQRVPVKIVFEKGQDSEHLLRPGMSVAPTVLTQ